MGPTLKSALNISVGFDVGQRDCANSDAKGSCGLTTKQLSKRINPKMNDKSEYLFIYTIIYVFSNTYLCIYNINVAEVLSSNPTVGHKNIFQHFPA